MVSMNFAKGLGFENVIPTGDKSRTIRASRRCVVGQVLHLYMGLRHKNAELLGLGVCTGLADVIISPALAEGYFLENVSGVVPETENGRNFYELDGFGGVDDFLNYFENTLEAEPIKIHTIDDSTPPKNTTWRFMGCVHVWKLVSEETANNAVNLYKELRAVENSVQKWKDDEKTLKRFELEAWLVEVEKKRDRFVERLRNGDIS